MTKSARIGIKIRLSKDEWIARYGGQSMLDSEGFDVVTCGDGCEDGICHGWRVERKRPDPRREDGRP